MTPKFNKDQIFKLLSEIPDPEIPVINISELGILRDVRLEGNLLTVVITPTYTGCPAMKVIEDDIRIKLKSIGINDVKVELVYSPAWTTDWISDEAKEKLRVYGIAPPDHTTVDKNVLLGKSRDLKCPLCGSKNTEMISQFGSTACKALYRCLDCREPFDYFKCI
ncbi:MAG: phenylacetate-CoA oxygenase subunit PaaJ [Bacteroidetes bacterium]|nr:phenylacetate-CoA oxygenase subunit PaaJ [Bacteroidota bacterium]